MLKPFRFWLEGQELGVDPEVGQAWIDAGVAEEIKPWTYSTPPGESASGSGSGESAAPPPPPPPVPKAPARPKAPPKGK